MDNELQARSRMVDEQIAARGITDLRVLDAMRRVPRHEFTTPADRQRAYADRALPIGYGQTISQPYMVAAMTEALRLRADAHLLEIGTGSGYQAAVLAAIVRDVVSIERIPELARQARDTLARVGCSNVRVVEGDGTRGWPDDAPYDAIIVTAGAPHVPEALQQQLADGGRLVIPVGSRHVQHLMVITRDRNHFHRQTAEACAFVPLVGLDGWTDEA